MYFFNIFLTALPAFTSPALSAPPEQPPTALSNEISPLAKRADQLVSAVATLTIDRYLKVSTDARDAGQQYPKAMIRMFNPETWSGCKGIWGGTRYIDIHTLAMGCSVWVYQTQGCPRGVNMVAIDTPGRHQLDWIALSFDTTCHKDTS